MSIKDLIISNLKLISENEVAYKKKFYKIAISNIQLLSEDEIRNRTRFDDLAGIGKKINIKILDIVSSKKNLQQVDDLIEKFDNIGFDISTVFGIGKKIKEKIENKYGKVSSLLELRELDEEHNFLSEKNRIGLKYYDDMLERIPKKEMLVHDAFIKSIITDNNFDIQYDITGSFRRDSEFSGDIDILITSKGDNYEDTFVEFVKFMIKKLYITDTLAFGNKKFMGLCRLPGFEKYRRIDVIVTKPEDYYFNLLYFTGNDDFNKQMRSHALTKGYSLNQYNYTEVKTEKKVTDTNFDSEEAIFNFIGLKYVTPNCRDSGALVFQTKNS